MSLGAEEFELDKSKYSESSRKRTSKVSPANDDFVIKSDNLETKLADGEENVKRENWTGKLDFFLSALSYSVGLGAVWRFPYLCYKQGGGAFLLPFFICLVFIGIPLMFLEMIIGQFTSQGPLTCWTMTPIFRGVGISMTIINNYVNIYYIMILAYSFYYIVLSFNSVLPWEKCNPAWSSPNCVDNFDAAYFNFTKCENETLYLKCDDGKCYDRVNTNGANATCEGDNLNRVGWWNPVYPSENYWQNVILKQSESIDETGIIVWELVIGLLVAWILVFFMLFKGVKVSGKIVYFTALFPYLVLFILGIRGWLLPGADIGIKYYITPDFEKLKDANVWSAAAVQVFFTLSLSYGGLVTLASYNPYKKNIMIDAIVLSICNFLTCILAGFVVFAYMGYLSKQTGLDIDKVVQSGQGLAYVVYPYAASTIVGSQFWAVLFFLMMLSLGMGTMMASVETFITSINDNFPFFKKTKLRQLSTIFVICVAFFLLGIILCTQSGTYWIELFDTYSGNWAMFIIAIAECVSVSYFYGLKNLKKDISTMLGSHITNSKFFILWEISWMVICPLSLTALCIFSWIESEPIKVGTYEFPLWTDILGNLLSLSSVAFILIWAAYMIIDASFINKRSLITLIKPDFNVWRPLLDEDKLNVDIAHGRVSEKQKLIIDK